MKPKGLRSMRDIPTNQSLKNHAIPQSRDQLISEYARLEYQKSRLERELNVWMKNLKKTEDRIRNVQERLSLIQNLINDIPGNRQPPNFQSPSDGKSEKSAGFKEISIEY